MKTRHANGISTARAPHWVCATTSSMSLPPRRKRSVCGHRTAKLRGLPLQKFCAKTGGQSARVLDQRGSAAEVGAGIHEQLCPFNLRLGEAQRGLHALVSSGSNREHFLRAVDVIVTGREHSQEVLRDRFRDRRIGETTAQRRERFGDSRRIDGVAGASGEIAEVAERRAGEKITS